MTEKVYRSKCCNAEVKADGTPDFIGSNDVCTVSFICLKCKKPCDIVGPKSLKQNVCAAKKSGIIKLNVNDDIEVCLTREGRHIYQMHWKKYCLRPALLKKSSGRWVRFQLWDFMHIFGNAMYMGASNVIVGNVIRIPKP